MKDNQMFPKDFYEYINKKTLIEVKGGKIRPTFLKIWVVTVDNRVFARSWNKSEKSWFTEFQKTGYGEIKYGNIVIDVKGRKLKKTDKLNTTIDNQYIKKYTQPENIKYAKGITKPEYSDYTMEFYL